MSSIRVNAFPGQPSTVWERLLKSMGKTLQQIGAAVEKVLYLNDISLLINSNDVNC